MTGFNGYDLILFDLDGTLTEPKEGITKSIQYALKKFNIFEENLDSLVKFIGPPLQESFMKYYCFDQEEAWQAVLYYREYFAAKGMYQNSVYNGIPRFLQELQSRERKLVIATSKPTVYSEKILKHFDLNRYFDVVVGSNLDGTRVLKAEVIKDALKEAVGGREKSRTVMIGDREHDIIGARDNGIDSIAVCYGYGSREELENAGPTYQVDSVDELAKLLLASE